MGSSTLLTSHWLEINHMATLGLGTLGNVVFILGELIPDQIRGLYRIMREERLDRDSTRDRTCERGVDWAVRVGR